MSDSLGISVPDHMFGENPAYPWKDDQKVQSPEKTSREIGQSSGTPVAPEKVPTRGVINVIAEDRQTEIPIEPGNHMPG